MSSSRSITLIALFVRYCAGTNTEDCAVDVFTATISADGIADASARLLQVWNKKTTLSSKSSIEFSEQVQNDQDQDRLTAKLSSNGPPQTITQLQNGQNRLKTKSPSKVSPQSTAQLQSVRDQLRDYALHNTLTHNVRALVLKQLPSTLQPVPLQYFLLVLLGLLLFVITGSMLVWNATRQSKHKESPQQDHSSRENYASQHATCYEALATAQGLAEECFPTCYSMDPTSMNHLSTNMIDDVGIKTPWDRSGIFPMCKELVVPQDCECVLLMPRFQLQGHAVQFEGDITDTRGTSLFTARSAMPRSTALSGTSAYHEIMSMVLLTAAERSMLAYSSLVQDSRCPSVFFVQFFDYSNLLYGELFRSPAGFAINLKLGPSKQVFLVKQDLSIVKEDLSHVFVFKDEHSRVLARSLASTENDYDVLVRIGPQVDVGLIVLALLAAQMLDFIETRDNPTYGASASAVGLHSFIHPRQSPSASSSSNHQH